MHFPEAVFISQRAQYCRPLHVAVAHAVDPAIVELLLEYNDRAVYLEDYYDDDILPLHIGLIALEKNMKNKNDYKGLSIIPLQ